MYRWPTHSGLRKPDYWQPEFTDKTLSRKPGAVHPLNTDDTSLAGIIGLRLGNEQYCTVALSRLGVLQRYTVFGRPLGK